MVTNTVNATEAPVPIITPDGDFDSGVICHEYGHGVSTRLTGGPINVYCLDNAEQMGEGMERFLCVDDDNRLDLMLLRMILVVSVLMY
jgi:hypothetical protein